MKPLIAIFVVLLHTACANPNRPGGDDACIPPTDACDVDPAEHHERLGESGAATKTHALNAGDRDAFLRCEDERISVKGERGAAGGLGTRERIVVVAPEEIEALHRDGQSPNSSFGRSMVLLDAVSACQAQARAMCAVEDCARAAGVHDGPTWSQQQRRRE